jgi:8-oxo-dGTP pyrophosphatase MutT (NUDIX family)
MARVSAELTRVSRGLELPIQVAAVCYRVNGLAVEFLLVNTSSGKWTFPKGRLSATLTPSESAAREAWEEAGARGRIAEKHFTSYVDIKRALGHTWGTREVLISAYLFEVESTVSPQESDRNPSWFSPRDAKKQLAEGRSSRNAKQIASVIDVALHRLAKMNGRRTLFLSRAQVRRLASAQ